jgi:hypothetical protein
MIGDCLIIPTADMASNSENICGDFFQDSVDGFSEDAAIRCPNLP